MRANSRLFIGRISQSLKQRDWFGVFVEFAAVVLGVLLGFQASQWADQRRIAAEREALAERLVDDLRVFARQTEYIAEQRKGRLEAMVWLDGALRNGGVDDADADRLFAAADATVSYDDVRPLPISFTNLVSSTSLDRLDPEARGNLEYLSRVHSRQEVATDMFHQHVRDHWDFANALTRLPAGRYLDPDWANETHRLADPAMLETPEFQSVLGDALQRDSMLLQFDRQMVEEARKAADQLESL